MHIKKLEISGFKSFVERTVIHFDHDVIGIVGPNGCGKSNIVDAIRWCMGEQSAKHLRGRAMEDVIFNGSDSRPPAGLAEVTLTFDNTDPTYAESLPLEYRDYAEIAITRRLFRDGTSEYLINKSQVRLRDITELFLGTGVGTKAYSIVEQGRIGQIVSARPEDRRLFIEEAAGVTKYKQRRKQAERKMELTRQNLARITDIVREIERSGQNLQRQVQKAERYKQLRVEYEDLLLHDASHQLLEATVVGRVHREALDGARTELERVVLEQDSVEQELGGQRESAQQIESRTESASKRAFERDNEVSSLRAENQRAKDRIVHLDARLAAAASEQTDARVRASQLTDERAEIGRRLESLTQDEAARSADAASEDQALAQLRAEETAAQQDLDQKRRAASTFETQAAASGARLDAARERRAAAEARKAKLGEERERVGVELEALRAKQRALEVSVEEAASGKQMSQTERQTLEAELTTLRSGRLEAERDVDQAKNELGLKKNRLRVLEDLHKRLEGVGAGARALVGSKEPGVLGLVADRIEAPEELTQAFVALLGERLQYVVVSDPELGLRLLDGLRSSGRGRGHVIPARPGYTAGRRQPVLDGSGVVGLLADQLGYRAEDGALVEALVGDAVLVETAADAVGYVRRVPGATAVSRDGTVARPEGVISGGAGDGVAAAMVEQKREMHQLVSEVARLEATFEQKAEVLSTLRARLVELETALERARQAAHQGELAHVSATKDLARTAAEIDRVLRREGEIGSEEEKLAQGAVDAEKAETEISAQLEALALELTSAREGIEGATAQLTGWRERVAAQASLVMERKVRLAQVKEQTEAARSSLSRIGEQLGELEARQARLSEEADEAARAFGETAARIMACREARIVAAEASVEAHRELETARGELEAIRVLLGDREGALRELRVRRAELDEGARVSEMALQRVELGLEHLLGTIREKFRGLDLRRVVGDYHLRPAPDADQKARIEDLARQIDRIGPVNLDAEREFGETQARFEQLSAQKVDIEAALAELEKAIKHMDRESRNRFKETFDAVNELFKKSFAKNFRGGRAELRLTEPDDLLNTGVDIIAQPPGKKLGNIELMSGGEKALTAVSLIFAIFQHRPSPFCVLDEVDAPLDEANVSRYNEAIRTMTANSQFILITHIRKTMQSVDVLYGVTMGEPGVSRLVSVKVNDEARSRSEVLQENRGESVGGSKVA